MWVLFAAGIGCIAFAGHATGQNETRPQGAAEIGGKQGVRKIGATHIGEGRFVLPGSGEMVQRVGDDFEAGVRWRYDLNFPKSSRNIDDQERSPLARSTNGRWLEGPHRGTPDVLKIVDTPRGGLPGSRHALYMATRYSGIPGRPSGKPQQDDLMVEVHSRLGRRVAPAWQPSAVVRVYVPPYHNWEQRTGASLGFRLDVWGRRPGSTLEQYWPGIFLTLRSSQDGRVKKDQAYLVLRANEQGRDIVSRDISPGWWTLGMSVSGDGKCHFFAKKGVDDLTVDDWLESFYCYGYRAQRFDRFFFNVVTMDNGRTWSTPWILDDPTFYCRPPHVLRAAWNEESVRR